MGEGEDVRAVFERGAQLGELAVEFVGRGIHARLQARLAAPMRQPLQQRLAGEAEAVVSLEFVAIMFGDPLDEFPILGGKEFLFVRRAHGEVY